MKTFYSSNGNAHSVSSFPHPLFYFHQHFFLYRLQQIPNFFEVRWTDQVRKLELIFIP